MKCVMDCVVLNDYEIKITIHSCENTSDCICMHFTIKLLVQAKVIYCYVMFCLLDSVNRTLHDNT